MPIKNLLTLADVPPSEAKAILERARALKADPGSVARALFERTLLMIFEAPSLRTRLSFTTAMTQLGGHAIDYATEHSPWGVGKETIEDTARTISRYCDAITARLYDHRELVGLAQAAEVPVLNAMTDLGHPCQILSDLLTIEEALGRPLDPEGDNDLRVAYLGDAHNNVTYSFMRAAVLYGFDLAIASPPHDLAPDPAVLAELDRLGDAQRVTLHRDPRAAVEGAHIVTTDSWMSYRVPPRERARRVAALAPYRVTSELLAACDPAPWFLHCLPARRGDEVEAEVIDGPRSVVFDQAENRLHVQKAILLERLAG